MAMGGVFDLKNNEQMKQSILIMKTNTHTVEGMLGRFPFHHLGDVAPIMVDAVCNVCDMFQLFLKYGNIQNHLLKFMQFFNKTIIYLINNDECDFEVVEKVLEEFKDALLKEDELLSSNYTSDALVGTLHSIAHHPNVTDNALRLSILCFTNYLWRKFDRDDNFGEYCFGLWKAARDLTKEECLALTNAFICNTDPEVFPNINEVYRFVIVQLEDLAESEDQWINNLLDCIINVYTKCKSKEILKTISIALARISFPRCIANYFLLTENNLQQMHEILFQEISVLFEKTPWNSAHNNLREVVTNLGKPFLVKQDPEDDSDFGYLMIFLELIYNDVRHTEVPLMNNMIKQFSEKLPANPAVLKCVYLLHAAYCESPSNITASRAFQNDLLLSLQYCKDLKYYLTYHIAQLTWVLKHGSRILKRRVVTCWVRQEKMELMGALCRSLIHTEQVTTLLDVLFCDDDLPIKHEALELYLYCEPGNRIQLTHLLLRKELTIDTLDCIMRGKPKEMILCRPEDPKYKGEVQLFCAMIQRLISIVTNEQIELLDATRCTILIYLHNTCWQLRETEHAECFVVGRLAKILVESTKSKSTVDAWNACEFLMLIATTQVHLKINIEEKVQLEPTPFVTDSRVIKSAVRLYHYTMNPAYGDIWLISMKGKHLALYHHLMDALTSSEGSAVYELIVLLLESYEDCVVSMINICAIRTHCRQVTLNVNFVKYLTIWCQLAPNYKHIRIPVRCIAPFVKYLEANNYKDADYAVLKKFSISS